MVPHVLAAAPVLDEPVLEPPAALPEPAAELDAGAELEELDEPDEQAARPRPAARARAAMPPVCTALIDVSFDIVVGWVTGSHGKWSGQASGRPGQVRGHACPGRRVTGG